MKVKIETKTKEEHKIRKKGSTCYGIDFDDDCCDAYISLSPYIKRCLVFDKTIPNDYREYKSQRLIKKLPECIEMCKSKEKEIIILRIKDK